MFKKPYLNYIPIVSMILIFIIDLALIYTTHSSWNNSMKKYLPLKSEIQAIKNEVTIAHLWFEEAISGDNFINLEKDVFEKLRHKKFKQYIKEAEEILETNDDKIFFNELKRIDYKIDDFYILAQNRWDDVVRHRIGSALDQEFDRQFNVIINLLSSLNMQIDENLQNEFKNREGHFMIIISLFLMANLLMFWALYIFKKRNETSVKRLYAEKEKALVTLKSIGDAVITTDKEGIITYLNPIAESLTAYSNKEAQGLHLDRVFNIINELSMHKVSTPVKKVLDTGQIVELASNTALVNKNNDVHSIEDSAAPIRDNENNIIGVVLVFHDVTKQNKVRQKLNESERILLQQSKMAAMGEMLENIAHQWRQPLSVISTSSTGIKLKKELNDLDDEFLITSLDLINDSTQHLSKTIDSFRGFFKPDKEKQSFHFDDLYLKTKSLISSKLQNRDIKLIEDIESVKFFGFENELIQVLMNLINNAIDILSEKDGLKLIFFKVYQEESKMLILIKDNGGGINQEIVNRVFEPYFTTKHQTQGTGIGLYMSEEIIVKHMNGKIIVENKNFEYEGQNYKGAEFLIELPL